MRKTVYFFKYFLFLYNVYSKASLGLSLRCGKNIGERKLKATVKRLIKKF